MSTVFGDDGAKADIGISRFSFVQTHGGQPEWALQAEHAELFDREQKATLKEVAVTIQTGNGLNLELEGDEGIIDTQSKDFSLRKKTALMEVVLGNGYVVRTSGLNWTNASREISTDGFVTISGPEVEVEGTKVRWSLENQELVVSGNVKAVLF